MGDMLQAPIYPRFEQQEYVRRYTEIRRGMTERGLNALVVWGDAMGWGEISGGRIGMANPLYLSNFADQLREYVILPLHGDPELFTFSISHYTCAQPMSVVALRYEKAQLFASVADRLRGLGLDRGQIGLVGGTTILGVDLPMEQVEGLHSALPTATWSDATDLMEAVRMAKSGPEIERLRQGAEWTDLAFEAVKSARLPLTEAQLYARAAAAYLPLGGHLHRQSLASTAMADPKVSAPGYLKSERTIRPGDVIHVELSAGCWGYAGWLARPVFVGGAVPQPYRNALSAAIDIYHTLLTSLRPGVAETEVRAALERSDPGGWRRCFPTVRGWGLGLEPPVVAWQGVADTTCGFREGMMLVAAVRAGPPSTGAVVTVGDLVRVEAGGAQPLQKSPYGPVCLEAS